MKTEAAFGLTGLALAVGLASGYAAAGDPVVRTPTDCHDMAEYAMDAFKIWGSLVDATRERGDAPDVEARAVATADVNHILASLEAIAPKYDAAAADCVGAS